MSNVEFDEENTLLDQMPRQVEDVSTMAKFIMKIGLAKTKSQVNIVLTVVAVGSFALAIYIIVNFVL